MTQAVANCAPGAIERVLKLTRERLARFAETRGPSGPPSAAGVRSLPRQPVHTVFVHIDLKSTN